ncbi:MurR/RpiR family transcriptional regulator [Pelagibius sp. Alg239-R121]|uniref:MurR/RpiR family transcriptional regulator n=1 Tax=Pelagibius sp. Alg239-R121 TaxID=2993448 RepID=UPI0024A73C5B|nr:MurR/RpiR family transcriptional regulator [Pelagibius sp. Alg239-R121]
MAFLRDKIEELGANLTSSERKVASVVLADYPFAGLQTIQELAKLTSVSAPSITRFVSKLGCNGYQEFQRRLIGELKESHRSPVDLKLTENPAQEGRFLADYADRITTMMQDMAAGISQPQFDAVCSMIGDPSRNIFLIGGRMSDSLATLLSMHLRQIRGRIYHLPSNPEIWPDYVLRMRKQDVFVIFDFRRYQTSLTELARIVAEKRQAQIVTVTDRWWTPASRHAAHVLAVSTENGTAWDSHVSAMTLVEAIIVKVSEQDWDATRKRIGQWDGARLAVPSNSQEEPDGKG